MHEVENVVTVCGHVQYKTTGEVLSSQNHIQYVAQVQYDF